MNGVTAIMFRRTLAALLLAPLALGFANGANAADPGQTGPIQITGAFSRAAPVDGVSGLFLTIVNSGAADRLIGIGSPGAGKAELHESIDDKGVMKMRPIAALDIPAGGTVKLVPGGYHIMLIGLKQAVMAGGQVPITLTFEKAGKIEAVASVVKPGGGAPMNQGMNHGMSHGMSHDMGHGMDQMPPGMAPAK